MNKIEKEGFERILRYSEITFTENDGLYDLEWNGYGARVQTKDVGIMYAMGVLLKTDLVKAMISKQ